MPTERESSKTTPKRDKDVLAAAIEEYSASFDKLTQERHIAGAKEYGVVTFLGNDVIRMMMEELADTSNYCRMQFIKLMMLQHMLEQDEMWATGHPKEGDGLEFGTDSGSFKGTGEVGWK